MSAGILLLTHENLGLCLVRVAKRLLGQLPLTVECLEMPFDAELSAMLPAGSAALRRCDSGGGVLILTDLYGASPSNLGARLTQLGIQTRRVSGLSLPMLLRVMNYAEQPLDELVRVAAAAASMGTVIDYG